MSKKPGLYANIHAKRKRGEKMRKPGEEGAPSAQDFKNAAKTAKKNKGKKREDPGGNLRSYMDTPKMKRGMKRQDPKGNPAGYYDSNKKKKADMGRKGPYADGMGKKGTCDSVADELRPLLINDDEEERADKPCGNSYIPQNAKCSKGAGQAKKPEAGQGKPQLSDKQKVKAIRKVAAERFKGVKTAKLKASLKANKGNKSLEGRTVQKAARRELFNRAAKTGLQSALLSAPVGMYLESRREKKRL